MTTRLPALDPAALEQLAALGDDGTFVPEMIALFREETPPRVQAVLRSHAEGDAEGTMQEAHALKSSAAQLGARRLSELCRTIERRVRDGALHDADEAVAELQEAWAEADAALRTHLAERPSGPGEPAG